MCQKNSRVIMFAFLPFICLFCFTVEAKTSDKCIEGPHHKPFPSPEGPSYAECFPWKENACCTANFTIELAKYQVLNLWNFTWHHCHNLSKKCEAFIKNEECFWSCEPRLIKWHTSEGGIHRVPICADYCNAWFDACKDDMTCVQNWMGGHFNKSTGINTCPTNSKCRPFHEVFHNGSGICNTMWGSSFRYEESNKNCMVMNFSGPNPNSDVSPPPVSGHDGPLAVTLALLYMSLIAVAGLFR